MADPAWRVSIGADRDDNAHVRLVEDLVEVAVLPSFEIIAPMTAVKLVTGKIPDEYYHNYSRGHYLALKDHYTASRLAEPKSARRSASESSCPDAINARTRHRPQQRLDRPATR
jgi:hypothetical protein